MSLSIRNRALAGVLPWILPVVLLLAWQTGAQLGWITARVLPAPTDVVAAGWRLTVSGELWFHLKSSFERAAIGFVIGGGIGLALGFATGPVPLALPAAGQHAADGTEHSAPGSDSTGDPLVRD